MYFQVTIVNGKEFVIEESKKKRMAHGLALVTFQQIQGVFENHMRYCQLEGDVYAKWSTSRLYQHLKKQAQVIYDRYSLKASRCFSRQVRAQGGLVRKAFLQTQKNSPLPFPKEVIRKMLEYLTIEEILVFARLNHEAKRDADGTFELRMRKFGLTSEKPDGPKRFAICLRRETRALSEMGVIPEKYLQDHWESTLSQLRSISSEEILALFSHPDNYREQYPFFIRYLLTNTRRTAACPEVRILGANGLILAIQRNQREMGELLIKHGALINGRDGNGFTPLAVAARKGKEEIVRFFLVKKGDPNAADTNGNTPLHWAASLGFDGIVALLLEHGASPSLLNRNGLTPLDLGSKHPKVKAHLERAFVGVAK
ncbi:MAG: hypothetical protein A3E80_04935 [Chlamydiae bacterium RIFCSPHIGHO2_12_FULL_49_9]|nr:MAG: hypothetical protein A3E80_04935 [Chlamydiae bacterium RIFCSPHIGHO2_12_FULL_49_9]